MLLTYRRELLAYSSLIIAISIWGGLPTITKLALSNIDIHGFILIRFLVSSILLSPYLKNILKQCRLISLKHWVFFTITVSMMFYSQTWAIEQIDVSFYIIIFSITPVIMALCLQYKIYWQAMLGIIIVSVTLIVVFSQNSSTRVLNISGVIATFIGIFCWVIYSIFVTKFHHIYNDIQITALTSYIAFLISCILWFSHINHFFPHIDKIAGMMSACTGIILLVAFFCYSYALRYRPKFAIFGQYLEPIVGLIISAFVLGNILTMEQYVYFFFILAGVVMVTRYTHAQQ